MPRFVTVAATRGELRGMPCKVCQGQSRVIDTDQRQRVIRRRRECRACRFRWTTREREEETA